MPQTLSEKIFSQHVGREAKAGEIVQAAPDLVMSHDSTTMLAIEALNRTRSKAVKYPERLVIVFDHVVPAPTVAAAEIHQTLFTFAQERGIRTVYGQGISHQVLPEMGLIQPGKLVVGADSHSCTYGAFGAFGTGMGSTDIAAIWATGQNWFRVPETIKAVLNGKTRKGVFSKDVILEFIGQIGVDGASYQALEFHGSYSAASPINDRMTLSNMAIECGGKAGLFAADNTTLSYLKGRVEDKSALHAFQPDEDASYGREVEIDVSEVEPKVALPHALTNIVNLTECPETKVDHVFIGTCTNGRIEDLRQAAQVLKGQHVAQGTKCVVTPASKEVYVKAMKEGIIETFVESGALVTTPGCGSCIGRHEGVLAAGQVCVSTMNRNFKGRMGSPASEIILASPFVAGAAAVEGKIGGKEFAKNLEV